MGPSPGDLIFSSFQPGFIRRPHPAQAGRLGVRRGVLHFAPLALFMGPALVMIAANQAYRAGSTGDIPIGIPLIEAYPDAAREVTAGMFQVYETGCACVVPRPTGLLTIAPLIVEGQTVGVGTHFLPKHETPRWRLAREDLARSPQLLSRVGGRR
jgi:hypothetical protein